MLLAAIAIGALLAAWVIGHGAGWVAMIAGLLGVFIHSVRSLACIANWAGLPSDQPPAEGSWVFAPVFHNLQRHSRYAREERERLTIALERFRAASQAMPDGVIYLSENDAIEWLNGRAEQHFGLDHARDTGVKLVGLVRQAELARCLDNPISHAPLSMQSPRRPEISLLVQVVPFGDGQKMVISRDITQIERLETMRQDFIANVSHELRTPLTVVGGFLETVKDGLDDLPPDDVARYLGMALDQSTRMRRLIEDLLALSALETSAPAPAEEAIDMAEFIRQIHQEAELLSVGRHQITLQLDVTGDCGYLIGSERELHSAFANLASNAVRYTPEGGQISIRWQCFARSALFQVTDNGLGIDSAHIPRLTERFFRADKGRSRETGGTGLGLAIVKHVLSRHQAELSIESTLGKGSCFSVRFPGARIKRTC